MNNLEKIVPLTSQMLQSLSRLIRHNSVKGAPEEGKPFGAGPSAALAEALSIASEIAALHHGRLYAKDTPGGGATFTFELPYK